MTIRISLALLAVALAAMAYPWQSVTDRWIVGGAVVVVLITVAWWRGLFLTTMLGRRIAMWRRRGAGPARRDADQMMILLQVDDPAGVDLPLPLVAGYVDRFGVRCASVRVTSRDRAGVRTTWIGMTLDAVDNLAALRARSPELPLYDTTEVVGRRLADHLRETGLEVTAVNAAVALLGQSGRETWTGVRDEFGFVSAYGVRVDDRLVDRLAEVSARSTETWVTLEFSGTAARPTVAAACAVRTAEPVRGAPLDGLVVHRGLQRPLLTALDPTSAGRLGIAEVPVPDGLLERVTWRAGSTKSASVQQSHL